MRETEGRCVVIVLLLGLLSVGALGFAPTASGYIYWADGGQTGAIGRAENDGSGANPNFITGQKEPCGLAVDSQHIYWANQAGASIGRANLDGTGVDPNFITTATFPCGVASDGAQIWWGTQETGGGNTGSVARANLDGSSPSIVYSTAAFVEGPRGIGVGSNLVFWTNEDASPPSVGRAGVDGTPPPAKSFISLPDSFKPVMWPAVGAGRLYFATLFGLLSTDLNGGSAVSIFGANAFGGIVVFGSRVYWANFTEGTISRANLDLSSPDFAFIKGLGSPAGIAVDGGATPSSSPAPKKCKKPKGKKKSAAAAAKKHKKCKKKPRR